MVPNNYVIEVDDSVYGPFATAELAFMYAQERGMIPVFIRELLAP